MLVITMAEARLQDAAQQIRRSLDLPLFEEKVLSFLVVEAHSAPLAYFAHDLTAISRALPPTQNDDGGQTSQGDDDDCVLI